eukprot:TRINITY_DN1124_c0_g1_i1.p1 TRINITY_DN1124_c0_g1~~TRINITY_DN1124_c0_g1_i1.p1  ORF type:complete len:188 (-),score=46.04 TRINITY_DN1124_c0_g1_i1:20-583(-)
MCIRDRENQRRILAKRQARWMAEREQALSTCTNSPEATSPDNQAFDSYERYKEEQRRVGSKSGKNRRDCVAGMRETWSQERESARELESERGRAIGDTSAKLPVGTIGDTTCCTKSSAVSDTNAKLPVSKETSSQLCALGGGSSEVCTWDGGEVQGCEESGDEEELAEIQDFLMAVQLDSALNDYDE